MNMNAQTMRWSDIEVDEGSQMQTLSSSEVEDVSGASWWGRATVTAVVVYATTNSFEAAAAGAASSLALSAAGY